VVIRRPVDRSEGGRHDENPAATVSAWWVGDMDNTWIWFHATTHTYGAWLYGDPRGFRTRHHRYHLEGDYKNPPPKGMYDAQLAQSKRLLKQEPVVVPLARRPVIGAARVEMFLRLEAQLLCLSISGQHAHLLAKMPAGPI
jgi:hypothetical protein